MAWRWSVGVIVVLSCGCLCACDTAWHHVGGELDVDGDGHGVDHDCDDRDAAVHPAASEVPYDGIDQDCDGVDLVDVDGDGIASERVGGHDCDDHDATVHPGAEEICDHRDNDCDGGVDEGFADTDGDRFADCVDPTPAGFDGSEGREAPLSAQLHLHGSLSECTGTMMHHTSEAERVGVDVLWWSDHSAMIAMAARTGGFDFDGGELLQTEEILYREVAHGFSVVESGVIDPVSAVLDRHVEPGWTLALVVDGEEHDSVVLEGDEVDTRFWLPRAEAEVVRAEVRDLDGVPILISNPIYLLEADEAVDVDPLRLP